MQEINPIAKSSLWANVYPTSTMDAGMFVSAEQATVPAVVGGAVTGPCAPQPFRFCYGMSNNGGN